MKEAVFPPVDWPRPNYGGGNEDKGNLLQEVPCMHCCTQRPQPCSRLPLTHTSPGDSRTLAGKLGSVSCGDCSFLRGPCVCKLLFVPSKSLFPHSCVSSDSSMVGLMVTSFKRAYAIPRSTAPRAAAPAAVHCWPVRPQETLKHSSGSVSVGSLGPVCTRFVWALWASLTGMRFDSKCSFAPPTFLLGFLLCPWMWGIFFWWDPTSSCQWLFSTKL